MCFIPIQITVPNVCPCCGRCKTCGQYPTYPTGYYPNVMYYSSGANPFLGTCTGSWSFSNTGGTYNWSCTEDKKDDERPA